MMGFKQNQMAHSSWGYGQRYVKYDIMGREILNRRLPDTITIFHTSRDVTRPTVTASCVASPNYKRPDVKKCSYRA